MYLQKVKKKLNYLSMMNFFLQKMLKVNHRNYTFELEILVFWVQWMFVKVKKLKILKILEKLKILINLKIIFHAEKENWDIQIEDRPTFFISILCTGMFWISFLKKKSFIFILFELGHLRTFHRKLIDAKTTT